MQYLRFLLRHVLSSNPWQKRQNRKAKREISAGTKWVFLRYKEITAVSMWIIICIITGSLKNKRKKSTRKTFSRGFIWCRRSDSNRHEVALGRFWGRWLQILARNNILDWYHFSINGLFENSHFYTNTSILWWCFGLLITIQVKLGVKCLNLYFFCKFLNQMRKLMFNTY